MPGSEETEWPVIGPVGFTQEVADIPSGVFLVTKDLEAAQYRFPFPPNEETPEWVLVYPNRESLFNWAPPLRFDLQYCPMGRFELAWIDPRYDPNPAEVIDAFLQTYQNAAANAFRPDTMDKFRDLCRAWMLLDTTARYHELRASLDQHGPWALRLILGTFWGWDLGSDFDLFEFTKAPWPDRFSDDEDGGFREDNLRMWADILQETQEAMVSINRLGYPTLYPRT